MKSALKPVINVLKYISDFLDMICRKLCLVIGIVMVVDLFLGVFTRFVLNSPLELDGGDRPFLYAVVCLHRWKRGDEEGESDQFQLYCG